MTGRAVADEVLGTLGLAIVGGELKAGHRFLLSDIEERFGVSRTVARDVVQVLAALGLLTAKRRAGVEVQPMAAWNVLDHRVIAWRLDSPDRERQITSLTEIRRVIEPGAARLAATARTDEQAAQMLELAQEMERLGKQGLGRSEHFLTADLAYHSLLLTASGNEMYAAMQGMVAGVLHGRSVHGLTPTWPNPQAMAGHIALARGLVDRDPEVAEAASRRLLEVVSQEIADQQPSGSVAALG